MDYEREAHEILSVEIITTDAQTAVIRRQHTMFAHVSVVTPTQATVGAPITITVTLVRWDDRTPITDEERDLVATVDGQQVAAFSTEAGVGSVTLQFETPGTYLVGIGGDKVQAASAELEVVVG